MRGSFWVRLSIVVGVPLLFFLSSQGSVLLDYPLATASLLCVVASLTLLFAQDLKKTIVILTTLCFFCYALFGWATHANRVEMAFVDDRIASVSGTLCEDSLLCESGKQLLRLQLSSCGTSDSAQGSARGILPCLAKVDEVLVSGSRVYLRGKLSPEGTLFLADSLQTLSISRARIFRRKALSLVERRFYALLPEAESRSLALMLLLGRSTDAAFPLKQMSLASGCAHTLALSGMHLQFFIGVLFFLLSPLLGKRRARAVSVCLPLLYVVLAGPKPSLVRAMGMALFSLVLTGPLSSHYGYLATACIQTFLFPSALSSMGSLFSYAAYGGLLCNKLISFYRPKLLEPLLASSYAVLFTALPTLAAWGSWQMTGILIAPIASTLIFWTMACSVLAFLFGSPAAFALAILYRALVSLFAFGGSLFEGGFSLGDFVAFLCVVLTCLASIGYAERALQKRRRDSYELEVRIRFTKGNNTTA